MSLRHSDFSKKQSLLVAAILTIIAFLYIYRLGDKSLDFDERYSMNIATGIGGSTAQYAQFGQFIANPLPGATFSASQYKARNTAANVVSTAMNDNGQGLPYFLMLHCWLKLFGVSVFTARLLSVLMMLASLLLFYRLLRRWRFSCNMALLAVALFASNGVVIGLAQYLRFYSLGILLTVASSLLLCHLSDKAVGKWRFILLGLLWGIMLLNQFFAIFIVAAQAIDLLVMRWKSKPFLSLIPAACGALLPVLIWLIPLDGWESLRNIYTLHQGAHLAIPELTMPAGFVNTTLALTASFASAAGQPASLLSSMQSLLLQLLPALPALLLIPLLIRRQARPVPQWMRLGLLVICIYALASVVHTTVTGHTLLFQGRYWVFAYVFSYALLTWALDGGLHDRGFLRWIAVTALCFSCGRAAYTSASAISGLSLDSHLRLAPSFVQAYEDYEGLAAALVQTANPGDTVSYNSWQVAQRTNWFLFQHPELVQRVDTAQKDIVLISSWPLQKPISIGKGRTLAAQPIWGY